MTMAAVCDEVGTLGSCVTDTSASSAIALTRASLEAVASTLAATEVVLAWLSGVVRTSAAIDVTRLSAISGDLELLFEQVDVRRLVVHDQDARALGH
jgi:hypothetical protein